MAKKKTEKKPVVGACHIARRGKQTSLVCPSPSALNKILGAARHQHVEDSFLAKQVKKVVAGAKKRYAADPKSEKGLMTPAQQEASWKKVHAEVIKHLGVEQTDKANAETRKRYLSMLLEALSLAGLNRPDRWVRKTNISPEERWVTRTRISNPERWVTRGRIASPESRLPYPESSFRPGQPGFEPVAGAAGIRRRRR